MDSNWMGQIFSAANAGSSPWGALGGGFGQAGSSPGSAPTNILPQPAQGNGQMPGILGQLMSRFQPQQQTPQPTIADGMDVNQIGAGANPRQPNQQQNPQQNPAQAAVLN